MRVSSCQGRLYLLYCSPLLKKTCVRQIVLDMWLPLTIPWDPLSSLRHLCYPGILLTCPFQTRPLQKSNLHVARRFCSGLHVGNTIYIYIYIYSHICIYIYIYIFVYVYRERYRYVDVYMYRCIDV